MKLASAQIDAKIKELGDWRGIMLAKVRALIHEADPEIVEEWKYMGTPIFSHAGPVWRGKPGTDGTFSSFSASGN